jgi:hypothetical protein
MIGDLLGCVPVMDRGPDFMLLAERPAATE